MFRAAEFGAGRGRESRTPQSSSATAPLSGRVLTATTMPPPKGETPAVQAVGFEDAEFGKFNLCFPNSSIEPAVASGCRLSLPAAGGSRQCLPGVGSWNRILLGAEFGKFNLCFPNSSIEPAAASGSRPCRPTASGCRHRLPDKLRWGSGGARSEAEPPPASPRRQRRQMISRKLLEIRRPWPLQSMAANGRR